MCLLLLPMFNIVGFSEFGTAQP